MPNGRLFEFPTIPRSKTHPRAAFIRGVDKLVDGVSLARLIVRTLRPVDELAILYDPMSLAAERYRQLRHTLDNLEDAPALVSVTSPLPRDGRSTLAANLALAYAAEDRGPVLLVDADFRRPAIHQLVLPEASLGLSHILAGEIAPEHAILEIQNSSLCVLPVGEIPADPLAALCSSEFGDFMASLRTDFYRVVIDTPPLLVFRDASAVAEKTDGALVVVRAGVDTKPVYLDALEQLHGVRVLGAVRNCATPSIADGERPADRFFSEYSEVKTSLFRRRPAEADPS